MCAAFADRDYTIRFTANAQGDITGTGNTLLTCDNRDARCAAARTGHGGTANNNNGIAVQYVDVDSDAATFDSSAATLNLPAGARVLFAGLYYGGRLQAGTGGRAAPSPTRRDQVLLRPPHLGAYLPLTASRVDDAPVAGAQTYRLYQGFVDVTDIVRAAGPGEYTVGNVQLGTGLDADQSGGWTLSVAYEDTNQPTRNLTIFDGFRFVLADGPPVDIPLSGFVTPRTGTVSTRIGLAAIEGDLGTTGDSATVNAGTPAARVLQNASNPANNFFNARSGPARRARCASPPAPPRQHCDPPHECRSPRLRRPRTAVRAGPRHGCPAARRLHGLSPPAASAGYGSGSATGAGDGDGDGAASSR